MDHSLPAASKAHTVGMYADLNRCASHESPPSYPFYPLYIDTLGYVSFLHLPQVSNSSYSCVLCVMCGVWRVVCWVLGDVFVMILI